MQNPSSVSTYPGASVPVSKVVSLDSIQRIVNAYRRSIEDNKDIQGMWANIQQRKLDIHNALMADDLGNVSRLLSDPQKTSMFYGYDNLCKDIPPPGAGVGGGMYFHLIRLGEAWGVVRLAYPETQNSRPYPLPDPNALIHALEHDYSVSINFPNPYAGESGLAIQYQDGRTRGVMSMRALHAIHQSLMLWTKLGRRNGRVLEIGAGLGRSAYYAYTFGIRDYTIVDIPLTAVAQAHFLIATLGDAAVSLYGEPQVDGTIRILPPSAKEMWHGGEMVVNCDSLTEMPDETIHEYWRFIKDRSGAFLSINREYMPTRVYDLVVNDPSVTEYTRAIFWLRAGYVEEYVKFNSCQ